jgi:hypothetical protein
MYIVISKPKRRSVAAGVSQVMVDLQSKDKTTPRLAALVAWATASVGAGLNNSL